MNEITTFRWSFEQDVCEYAKAGYEGIGVWRPKLSDYGERLGVRLLRETGLAVSNLLWAGGFTGSDGRSYDDSVRDAREAIELAAALHANCLVMYTGARGGHTANHARRIFRNALDQLLPFAEEFGVTLAIETMHERCCDDWTFLTDPCEALRLVESLRSEYVKLVLDLYHLCHRPLPLDQIAQLVPYVAVVHLADAKGPPTGEQNRCPLGEGVLPLREVLKAIVAADFQGFCDVELMGADVENCDYSTLLQHSREAITRLSGGSP